jgi:hypothetical protein
MRYEAGFKVLREMTIILIDRAIKMIASRLTPGPGNALFGGLSPASVGPFPFCRELRGTLPDLGSRQR